jgi:3-oxoacyl-[acyl-carrier protein] reductase
MTSLEGRVALVTGAGENLGRAVALALAGVGANLAVNVRENKARADEVATAARGLGVDAVTAVGDVADPDVDDALVEQVERELGPVDVLVHCVGYRPWLMLVDASNDEWRRVVDVNCSSFFYLARRVLPSMTERGFGRLIAIGGADTDRASPRHGLVAASKSALTALVKAVAVECGTQGVTANVVSPTITETTAPEFRDPERLKEFLAIPRPGRLDEIAAMCLYLASDQGAYITGQTMRVDGGFTL